MCGRFLFSLAVVVGFVCAKCVVLCRVECTCCVSSVLHTDVMHTV